MHHEDWSISSVTLLFEQGFLELVYQAQQMHRLHFDPMEMELCTLLSIKTGTCPEDCAYCPQSGHFKTSIQKENLLTLEAVVHSAQEAKKNGATRFCMGAAWRNPPTKDFPQLLALVASVKALGLETCMTLGSLSATQASALKSAGLDFYNHNIDTSRNFYKTIISTRTFDDRLKTIAEIDKANIRLCCGGILGMGETRDDRIQFLLALAQLPKPPESIPLNRLIPVPGTPLELAAPLEFFEFVRTIAVTRLMFKQARIRLSAGRETFSEEQQAWCFMAGANSIFYGEKLLTASNANQTHDQLLFKKLGLKPAKLRDFTLCP